MDDVYEYFYALYRHIYAVWIVFEGEKILVHPHAVCNHKQMDKIFKACREDEEDENIILEAMHSCVGCIGDEVPALVS